MCIQYIYIYIYIPWEARTAKFVGCDLIPEVLHGNPGFANLVVFTMCYPCLRILSHPDHLFFSPCAPLRMATSCRGLIDPWHWAAKHNRNKHIEMEKSYSHSLRDIDKLYQYNIQEFWLKSPGSIVSLPA